MSEKNKKTARYYIEEVWNKGNLSVMEETHAESYMHHDPHDPWQRTHGPGANTLKKMIHFYRGAFPDLHLTIEEIVGEGDVVVARFTSHATHKHEVGGLKPTHKTVKLSGIFWWRFADGKIVEGRPYWDAHGFLRQIGAVPELAKVF